MASTLRGGINGTFTTDQLNRLTWPVAWNGTKDAAEAQAEEADLRALVRDAKEAIEEASYGDHEGELAVEIRDGEIVAVVDLGDEGDSL